MTAFEDLKAAIRGSGLTTQELGLRAGVAYQTIEYWMRGATKSPLLDNAVKVAAVLGRRFELVNGAVRLTPGRVDRKPDRFTQRPVTLSTRAWLRQ